ncbi:MAG: folate-binding protein [Mariprofundaceae bacterium]|nr:folate-binding protein [Mariprofundaceae bacterium]
MILPKLELIIMTDHHIAMLNLPSIQTLCCHRTSLAVLKASGEGIRDYLQGQITQDINLLTPTNPIYTAVLTPQGKMIADMHIIDIGDELILITQATYAATLVERLRRFALGHGIRLGCVESLGILSIQGEATKQIIQEITQPIEASLPMSEAASQGVWLVMKNADIHKALANIPNTCDESDLEKATILYGTPRFGRDWNASTHPLNANLIEMNGVNFDKGCYVGQEVTSRMHWRKGIKKKLYHVKIKGNSPHAPCPIQSKHKIGMLTSAATNASHESFGIAHLPIESVENNTPLSLENGDNITVLKACHA